MELTEILNWVFGGTSLVGLATSVIFNTEISGNKKNASPSLEGRFG